MSIPSLSTQSPQQTTNKLSKDKQELEQTTKELEKEVSDKQAIIAKLETGAQEVADMKLRLMEMVIGSDMESPFPNEGQIADVFTTLYDQYHSNVRQTPSPPYLNACFPKQLRSDLMDVLEEELTPEDISNSRYPPGDPEPASDAESVESKSGDSGDDDGDDDGDDGEEEEEEEILKGKRAVANERAHEILFDTLLECAKRMKRRRDTLLLGVSQFLNVALLFHFSLPFPRNAKT